MKKEFVQTMFEWIRSGLGDHEYSLSRFNSGFLMTANDDVFIPNLYFFLPECESVFESHLTPNSTIRDADFFEMNQKVEVYTFSPDLKIKKLLRQREVSCRQTLYGMRFPPPRANTFSTAESTQTNEGEEPAIQIQPLTEKQIEDYLLVQNLENQLSERNIQNEKHQEQYRRSVAHRLTLPHVRQNLVMVDKKVIGAVSTITLFDKSIVHRNSNSLVGIFDLTIIPEYRGKGFGKNIVHHFLQQENHSTTLVFAVKERISFYEKLGFEQALIIHRWSNG